MRTAISTGPASALCALLVSSTFAQIYPSSPTWVSADQEVSTGGALVDLNRDGWPDFVVANGNDIYRQRLVVYYNRGRGEFPPRPDWQSADLAYNGHLDVADVNGDGWLDVAVALLLNEGGPAAKLYLNNDGTLSANPDWKCTEIANAFGVAFGDVNGDGRPDLAVATGWPYGNPHIYRNTVHLNVDGALEAAPSWQSNDTWAYDGAIWVDADRDGWQDLIGLGCNTDTWAYTNEAGALNPAAGWHTTDNSGQFAIMAAAGDVNGDGYRDLFVTDNTQLFRGSGYFRQYLGLVDGYFETTPSWRYSEGYGSAVALADVDADGRLDLATGAWWDYARVFINNGAGYNAQESWRSGGTSVVEKIVFGDVDNDGRRRDVEKFPAGGTGFYELAHQPIEYVVAVRVGKKELRPWQYAYQREHSWVSIGPEPTKEVEIDYVYSIDLEMAVTNWDSSKGNYLYHNPRVTNGNCNGDAWIDLDDYSCFARCMEGPGVPHSGRSCEAFDWDVDGDVDLADWREFELAFTRY
ncbi:MAG: VCBS repeat-containing protein [Phycisphaerales bacterium]|nr:MAG: VCBS repeat-containing protein [Phycisphaerales bacterium]